LSTADIFRAAFEQVPAGIGVSDAVGNYLFVNQRLCDFTGYTRDELIGKNFAELTYREDLPGCLVAVGRVASGDIQGYSIEKRFLCKDGSTVWAKLSVTRFHDGNPDAPVQLIAVIDDITDYKRALELQLKAEEMCSKAFRQTPMVVTLLSAETGKYLDVNEAYERLTGYSREEAIGRSPLDLNLWIDLDKRDEMFRILAVEDRMEGIESRFRMKDGRILTALTFAERIEIDGEPCIISAALDISDRKRLETELQELSGRLIKLQDDERRRISTELTESLGQSVAAVSFEISHLARERGECSRELQGISAKIQDIVSGIAIISQSLHPSGLDYTGLPWAIEVLCRQFTHVYGLQVGFRHEGVPASLPPDVALCLYRIVQEGLSNVIEHSGAREAWLELTSDGAEIRLGLWDKGIGFDLASVRSGLGLLTMRERSRRLDGELSLKNHNGTRIDVRIPLRNADAEELNPSLDFSSQERSPA
jgi:PAS domain S-box-containing protein